MYRTTNVTDGTIDRTYHPSTSRIRSIVTTFHPSTTTDTMNQPSTSRSDSTDDDHEAIPSTSGSSNVAQDLMEECERDNPILRKIRETPQLQKKAFKLRKTFINKRINSLYKEKDALKKEMENSMKVVNWNELKTLGRKLLGQYSMMLGLKSCYDMQVRLNRQLTAVRETALRYNLPYQADSNEEVIAETETMLEAVMEEVSSLRVQVDHKTETINDTYNHFSKEVNILSQGESMNHLVAYAQSQRSCPVCMDEKPEYDFVWSTECPHSICRVCVTQNRSVNNRRCVVCRVDQSDTFIALDVESTIMRFKNVRIEGSIRNQLDDEVFEIPDDFNVY